MRSLSGAGVRLPKFIVPTARVGDSPGFRLGKLALLVIALHFLPRIASAHTPGLSTAAFDIEPGTGTVDARFVFATAEPLAGLPLDRDCDGVVTEADLKAAREDLRAFLADGVEVSADGSPCPPSAFDASLSEVDGLVLTSTYACPRNAASLQVLLYYLSALAPGHREVVRLTAGSATQEAILTGERRVLTLALPAASGARLRHENSVRRLVVVTAVFTALMLGLFVWRWRSARGA